MTGSDTVSTKSIDYLIDKIKLGIVDGEHGRIIPFDRRKNQSSL